MKVKFAYMVIVDQMKVEWKYVTKVHGVLCVDLIGTTMML